MALIPDVAWTMINCAIDMANEKKDSAYFLDFYKLHILLYYAQGYMLVSYGRVLFKEEIIIDDSGPFIPGVLLLPTGYDKITEKIQDRIYPLTSDRMSAIRTVLQKYGANTKDELVCKARQDELYKKCLQQGGIGSVINIEDMKKHNGFLITE